MKQSFLIMAVALLLVGAGCQTTEDNVDTAVNAVNSAKEAGGELEDAMDAEKELMEEAESDNGMMEDDDVMGMMDTEDVFEDEGMFGEDEMMSMIEMEDVDYEYSGELTDVSGGDASGTAQSVYADDSYALYVSMENLPELDDGYFYEGWVVRPEPFQFISTGEVIEQDDGTWVNTYESATDNTDHINYVLTLEPDDGDPAPAEHILEGTMIAQ